MAFKNNFDGTLTCIKCEETIEAENLKKIQEHKCKKTESYKSKKAD